MTRVSPISMSADPSACLLKFGVMRTRRISFDARPSVRGLVGELMGRGGYRFCALRARCRLSVVCALGCPHISGNFCTEDSRTRLRGDENWQVASAEWRADAGLSRQTA